MERDIQKIKREYRRYWCGLILRILVFAAVAGVVFFHEEELFVRDGMHFFDRFSVLHLLWLLWVWYILEKLLPKRLWQHKGSRKYRASEFQPSAQYSRLRGKEETWEAYRNQRKAYAVGARRVFLVWAAVGVCLLLLKLKGIFNSGLLLLTAALFYVGDLVCIVIWCPFRRLLMHNRCCTQCRIYNWDTWMMILPLVWLKGFFSWSLMALTAAVVGVWEVMERLHPERFYPITNAALQCAGCEGHPGCRRIREEEKFWWWIR